MVGLEGTGRGSVARAETWEAATENETQVSWKEPGVPSEFLCLLDGLCLYQRPSFQELDMRLHEASHCNGILVLFQGLVAFKDVAVCFSQDQWSDLDPTQKEFYGEYVLEDDCGIVVSLCKEFQVFLECPEHKDLPLVGNWGCLRLSLHILHFSYTDPTGDMKGQLKKMIAFKIKGKRKCLESSWKLEQENRAVIL